MRVVRGLAASATLALALFAAGIGPAAAQSTTSTTVTTPASAPVSTAVLPPIPTLDSGVTDGQPAEQLLSRAISLSSIGVHDTALTTALSVTQRHLESDAIRMRIARAKASAADQEASRASRAASSAQAQLTDMASAVRQAAVALYTGGPGSLTISPSAGALALYAADYVESATSPYGVLVQRQETAARLLRAERTASAAKDRATAALGTVSEILANEDAQIAHLDAELQAVSEASAAAVAADHEALAAQAGHELTSGHDPLQFSPKSPLPAPLPTTSVALTWAFAELGRPYQWGGAGPSSFDCSGLTQFVWRAAGVAIPRVASDQYAWTVPVPLDQLLPGDLVFFGTTDIHHVGIYVGAGLMINAPHTGDVVRVSSIWWSDLAGFGRVHFPGTPVPPHDLPTPAVPAATAVVPAAGPVPSQVVPPAQKTPLGPTGQAVAPAAGKGGGTGDGTARPTTIPKVAVTDPHGPGSASPPSTSTERSAVPVPVATSTTSAAP